MSREQLLTYNQRTVKAIWDGWDNSRGIFHYLSQFYFTFDDVVSIPELDMDYYAFQSGRKQSTSAVLNMLNEDGELEDNSRYKIARTIYNRYHTKWERLFRAFVNEYSPLTSYSDREVSTTIASLDESGERAKSHVSASMDERLNKVTGVTSGSSTSSNNDSGSDVRTTSGGDSNRVTKEGAEVKSITSSGVSESDSGIFGFNSSTAVKSGEQSGARDNVQAEITSFDGRTDATANERGETETFLHGKASNVSSTESATDNTETETSGSRSDSGTESEEESRKRDSTRTHTVTREGFDKPVSELVKDYIDLWRDDFYSILFKDVDSYIALSVY